MTTQPWENEKLLKRPAGQIGQYVGARYVPKLMDDWSDQVKYDYLCQVNYFGDAYISKLPVPLGTPPTDTTYWMRFPYGAKIDDIYAQIADANAKINKNMQDIANLDESMQDAMADLTEELENEVNQINTSLNGLANRVTANEGMITTLQQGVVKLDGDIKKVDQKANGIAGEVTNLNGKVDTVVAGLVGINTSISQINTKLNNHETRITALEAGGGGDAPVIEQILETINVEHPPAPLQGMTKNSSISEKEKFEAIAAYAKNNKMSITFPSGTWHVGNAEINSKVYIRGNGTESKIQGEVKLNGETGLISVVESVEFLDNVSIGIDVKVDSCIFRNCGLICKRSQEYIINCQFYLTNTNKTTAAITMNTANTENVRVINCLIISERDLNNTGVLVTIQGIKNVSIIGSQIVGVTNAIGISSGVTVEQLSVIGCDIYNTKQLIDGSTNGCFSGCTASVDGVSIPINIKNSNLSVSGCFFTLNGSMAAGIKLDNSTLNFSGGYIASNSRLVLNRAKLFISGARSQMESLSLANSTMLVSSSSIEYFSTGWNKWSATGESKAKIYGCVNANGEIPNGAPAWVTVM